MNLEDAQERLRKANEDCYEADQKLREAMAELERAKAAVALEEAKAKVAALEADG